MNFFTTLYIPNSRLYCQLVMPSKRRTPIRKDVNMPIIMERSDADKIFVSKRVAAHVLDISMLTFDRLVKAGRVEITRVGKRVLVQKSSLERLAEGKATKN